SDCRIMMQHTALQLPPLAGGKMVAVSDHVDAAVDHVFLSPSRTGREQFCYLRDGVHEAIDHGAVEPIEQKSQLLGRLYPQQVIELIDVVLVEQDPVGRLKPCGQAI